MSIKSDLWIRRMAEGSKMIDPFEPGQVRRADNGRIISYGTSSYGYDVRCANEFKIFTNINSTIVDPKEFDERSFVDLKSDICIIPPNSFALARTVEYFRIPRSVLTICLGKSTYARCFSGDTRVALVDGTAPTLEEMATRHARGELFWGYSIGPRGQVMVTLLDAPRFVARDSLVEVTLDNGKRMRATLDHQFLRRNGRLVSAGDLRPGDSLMPLYRVVRRGYEMVYEPLTGHLYPTHRLADEWNVRHDIYEEVAGTHRHHIDFNSRNNVPPNVERMPASEHIRLHNADTYGEEFDAIEHSEAIRSALTRLAQDPEWRDRYSTAQTRRAHEFWSEPRYSEIRARVLHARRNPTPETREAHRAGTIRRFSRLDERVRHSVLMRQAWEQDDGARRRAQAEIARGINLRTDIDEQAVRRALDATGSIRGAGGTPGRNHRVESVRPVSGEHDTYCLTVPEAGNFALEAGVFTSNCGIIVNVTPLEPEWEGHVTLEFSNTTTLPAKIYANEGAAQMIFFEADEVCEVSYKDRGGKYQGQRGVTLPKA